MTEIEKHIKALKDTNEYVRQNAVDALGMIGDASAVPALIGLLKDTREDVHGSVAKALGRIGGTSAVPALIGLLKERDGNLSYHAMEALIKIGTPAVPALIEALKDRDEDVHFYAAYALVKIGGTSAVPALIGLLKDRDGNLSYSSYHVAKALMRINLSLEPTEVLASERLNPAEKYATLVALSKVRYNENGLSLNYKIGDVERFCRRLCDDPNTDEKVRQGALDVMNANSLLRPSSEANFSSAELLRPSKSTPETNAEKELVRASDTPTETEPEKQRPKSLFARLFGR